MQEALVALLPDQLDPYAGLIVGAVTAFLILMGGWIASKWIRRMLLKAMLGRNVDEALSRFLSAIVQYTVLAAALIASLGHVGIESTGLVAVLGAAGLAVGFALQGSLSNFASGVMILLFRPIDIGHRVDVGGKMGTVEEIGLFATTVITPSNETVIIPNSKIIDDSIVNYTARGTLRARVEIGVGYGEDIRQAVEAVRTACTKAELVLEDPAPDVVFVGFGASSLNLAALPWSNTPDFLAMQHNVRVAIYEELEERGIEIPFDQIVVHQAA